MITVWPLMFKNAATCGNTSKSFSAYIKLSFLCFSVKKSTANLFRIIILKYFQIFLSWSKYVLCWYTILGMSKFSLHLMVPEDHLLRLSFVTIIQGASDNWCAHIKRWILWCDETSRGWALFLSCFCWQKPWASVWYVSLEILNTYNVLHVSSLYKNKTIKFSKFITEHIIFETTSYFNRNTWEKRGCCVAGWISCSKLCWNTKLSHLGILCGFECWFVDVARQVRKDTFHKSLKKRIFLKTRIAVFTN